MPIDRSSIGNELPPITRTMEPGRLRLFASAIGETAPGYTEDERLPVPPTFLFGLELEAPDPFAWVTDLGVDMRHVLHGEQSFVYHSVAHSGDTLTARPRIADVYAKKGGALEFVVKQTEVTRADGSPVADLAITAVIRTPEGGR